MAEFKIKVGAEFDPSGIEAQIKKSLKDQKIKISFDIDDSSTTKAQNKMRQRAKAVENEFKQALALQKQITSGQRQLSNRSLDGNIADSIRKSVAAARVELNKLYSSYGKMFSDSQRLALEKARGGTPSKQIGNTKDSYNQMLQLIRQVEAESKRMISGNVDASQFASIKKHIDSVKSSYDAFRNSVNGQLNTSQLNKLDSAIQKTETNLKNAAQSFVNKINNGSLIGGSGGFDSVANQIDKLSMKTPELERSFSKLQQMRQQFSSVASDYIKTGDYDKVLEFQTKYNSLLDTTKNQLRSVQMQQDKMNRTTNNDNAIRSLENEKKTLSLRIENWMQNNSAATAQFGDKLNEIKARIASINNTADLNALRSEFIQTTLEAKNAGVAMMSFGDRLKKQAREYISYVGVAGAVAIGMQSFRQMAQNVLEVDTAMTGLYRVTDLTAKQYDALYSDMISASKEYGATLTDTINATSDWVRAGFDADTALGLADITAMYQHVADLDYDEASKNLLTAYKGFEQNFNEKFGNDATASVEHVADVYNELDNKFSVTSAGLGESLARSASALQLAGNTFEEAAALAGAATEVNQDPEKTGTALKTMSLRIRGMKGELKDLGEEYDDIESVSKMQQDILQMTQGAVNIFDSNGDFRSTYDILYDIYQIYDKLSSTDQAELLETLSGKNHANTVAGLLSNFGTAIEMNEVALNSQGSAVRENEKYIDSLQGRIDVMTSSIQVLSTSALDSDFLKGGLSAITLLIDGLNLLVENVGLVPTALGAAAAGFTLFQNKGITSVDSVNGRLKFFGKSIDEIKNIINTFASNGFGAGLNKMFDTEKNVFDGFLNKINNDKDAFDRYKGLGSNASGEQITAALDGASAGLRQLAQNGELATMSWEEFSVAQAKSEVRLQASNKSFKSISSIIKEYNNQGRNVGLSQSQIAEAVSETNSGLGSYLKNLNGANATMSGYAVSLVGATAKTVALTVASAALNAALTMGIGFAIGAAISWITSLINYESELAETVADVTTSFKQQHDELSKNKSSFDDAVASYDKLSSGIDKITGKNISLSSDEYEEYANAVNTIASMTPSLVQGYDAQGNAILNATANVESLTKAYNELIIAENNKLLNGDGEDYNGLSDILTDYQNDYKKLQDSGFWNNQWTLSDANRLEQILNLPNINADTVKEYASAWEMTNDELARFRSRFADAMNGVEVKGVDTPGFNASANDWYNYIAEATKQHPDIVRGIIDDFNTELESASLETKEAINAYFENAFLEGNYDNISEEMQSVLQSSLGNIDINSIIGDKTGKDAENALTDWMNQILDTVNNMEPEVQDKIQSAFSLQSMFQSGEISLGEYRKQLDSAKMALDKSGLDEQIKSNIEMSLNIDKVQGEWQSFVNRMTESGMKYNVAVDFANSLDVSEWAAAQELIVNGEIDWKDKTPDEIRAEIDSLAELNKAMQFSIDIEAETDSIDAVNTALSESVAAAGMSADSISALESRYSSLESYDPAKLFEKTSQGIRANRDEMAKLEDEMSQNTLDNVSSSIERLQEEYANVTKELDLCSDATERQMLLSDQQSYADKIAELSKLQAQYEGLTSAYKKWNDAQSSGEEGDIYDDVITKLESAAELYEKGLVGTNEFAAATEFMSGKDTSTMSVDEIVSAYQNALPVMNKYFTDNSDGIAAMLNDINKLNSAWVSMDDNGGWVINMSAEDMQNAANQLGTSTEALEAAFAKGSDYGLDIHFDSVYAATEALETMRTNAQNANETLKELGETNVTFSFESTDIIDLNQQIDKATELLNQFKKDDGTVDLSIEGAEEAQVILETLMLQKQEVSKPAIMNVDINTIGDDDIRNAIQLLQNLRSSIGSYSVQIAVDADTSETEAKIFELVGQLSQLKSENPQIFADLGLDTTEFNSALATVSNNIEVGATLDQSAIATIQTAISGIDSNVLVNVGIGDTSAVAAYTATEQQAKGTVNWDNNTTTVDNWAKQQHTASGIVNWGNNTSNVRTSFTATGTVKWTNSGGSSANGTANANGTAFVQGMLGRAFKQGNWGTNDSGVALMGELGTELIVRDGKYFTVGDDGAGFYQYKKGDIIFNHKFLFVALLRNK